MPGMTAYFGLLDIGTPSGRDRRRLRRRRRGRHDRGIDRARSWAAGSSGIAGGAEKCHYFVDELGFDAAIDYKAEDFLEALRRRCPKGIDVYFDNVGGDILDAALANLARHARIVICGAISQYNTTGPPGRLPFAVGQPRRMTGMIVFDYADRYLEATSAIGGWLNAGKLKSREDVVTGFMTFPERSSSSSRARTSASWCCKSRTPESRRSGVGSLTRSSSLSSTQGEAAADAPAQGGQGARKR